MNNKNSLILTGEDESFPVNPYPYPYSSSFLASRNPLGVIAENSPEIFSAVAHRLLDNQLATERNETIRSLASKNSDMVCAWLNNRHAGERKIAVCSVGGARRRGLFARGEEAALTTTVRIG